MKLSSTKFSLAVIHGDLNRVNFILSWIPFIIIIIIIIYYRPALAQRFFSYCTLVVVFYGERNAWEYVQRLIILQISWVVCRLINKENQTF